LLRSFRLLILVALVCTEGMVASAASLVLTSSASTAVFGSPVTLTAAVTPATATGKVTFYDGTAVLGTRPLTNGSAAFTTTLLASGVRSLKAYYAGDANNTVASSAAMPVTIYSLPQSGFSAGPGYETGGIAISVTAGDFNGDGKVDLAVASQSNNTVSVFLGIGNGTFQAAVNYSVGTTPYSVAAGDFNGDGNTDLVVANSGDNNVSVLLGNGDGTFAAAVNYKVGTFPAFVAVADFNGDGTPDLAVANRTGNTLSILLGKGDGTFQVSATLTPTGTSPQSIAVADFDGDGKADLAVADLTGNLGQGDVSIFLGNGNGTFRAAMEYAASTNPVSVVTGDFNGDGKPDLAVGNRNGNGQDVSILLGNGSGTFRAAVNYAAGQCNTIVVGDFNGDGIPDLATGNINAPMSLLTGKGDGTFGAATTYADSGVYSFAVADFNGDGRTDLAAANDLSFRLDILTEKQPFSTTGLVSSANPVVYGQSVTLTATVSTPGNTASLPAATGSVTFYDGTAVLGIQTMASGQAVLSTRLLSSGTYTLRARYSGDVVYSGSISTAISQTINALPENGFAGAVAYHTAGAPVALAAGDFNGDGIVDLVASSDTGLVAPYTVSVMLGKGDGTFQPAAFYPTGGGYSISVATGDFNGDGKTDLVVANSGSNNVSVLAGNGDGSFQAAAIYAVGNSPSYVAVGDFNGDGRTDLIVSNAGDNTVSVLLGNGDGTFQGAVPYATGAGPQWLAVGDFNGDGNADVVTANSNGGTVSVLLGNGDGTFQSAMNYGAGSFPGSVAIGDFNRDGKSDLAVANGSTVSILIGNGNGTFHAAVSYPAGTNPAFLAAGDFNGDGLADLAVVESNNLVILSGNGDGTFQTPQTYSAPWSNGGYPVVADFNGDGRSDIAVGSALFDSSVYVFLGQAPPVTTTTLSSSANPSAYGTGITLSATVTPSTAAGKVTFYDGTTILGTVILNNGQAVLNTSLLASGVRTLRAYYAGGTTGAPSGSALLKQTVNTLPEAGLGLAVPYNYGSPFAVGDFNGDGKPDLVTLANASVNILLNRGNGVFGAPMNYSAFYQPTGVVTGDFNGDGNLDLAVSSSSAGTITILLGNGDGTFRAPTSFNVGYNVQSVAVGDLNGDGKADLVAGFAFATTGSGINVYLGNGDGTFQTAVNYLPGVAAWSVAIGDFNGDGKADLAVANGVGSLIVLIGAGNGSFLPAVTYGSGSGPRSVAVGDLNGDGIADVITANYYGNTISVFLGKGDGTFQAASNVGAGSYPASVALGDFNGDGKPDLVVADNNFNNASNSNTVVVLFGKGDGTFSGSTKIGVGANPSLVVVGDFNGDSLTDLAVAAGPGVEILKGTPLRGTTSANVGLASSANPSTYGQNLTITATVTPSAATGRVAFYDAGALLETVPMAGGVATMQTSLLNSGSHSLQALYSGDTAYEAVSSAVLTQTVNPVAAQGFAAGPELLSCQWSDIYRGG
jgi:hypothetical protein